MFTQSPAPSSLSFFISSRLTSFLAAGTITRTRRVCRLTRSVNMGHHRLRFPVDLYGRSRDEDELTKSTILLAETSGDEYSLEAAAYVSFQFRKSQAPKIAKSLREQSSLRFFQSQNVSIVIRTICALTGRIEDKESLGHLNVELHASTPGTLRQGKE